MVVVMIMQAFHDSADALMIRDTLLLKCSAEIYFKLGQKRLDHSLYSKNVTIFTYRPYF